MAEKMIKNVFNWEHFATYLSGPIDFDRGNPWREAWVRGLMEIGFKKEQIFNPQNKPLPKGIFEFDLDNEGDLIEERRQEKDYTGLCRIVSQIAHVDLRLVDKSDLVLVNFTKMNQKTIQPIIDEFEMRLDQIRIFNKHGHGGYKGAVSASIEQASSAFYRLVTKYLSLRTPTYGTVHEIVNATNQHKPTMVVWEGGKESCSGWIMWLVGHRNVFGSFEELQVALRDISEGKKAYNAKDWLLFDFGRNGKP